MNRGNVTNLERVSGSKKVVDATEMWDKHEGNIRDGIHMRNYYL